MFTCSNCGHNIDDTRVPLPPFCPRCGEPTNDSASPFDDDEPVSPLPPPPEMGAPLPPPPPMGESLPPLPRSGRGAPSRTLFGMPGLSFDDPPPGEAADLPFPSDDEGELPFPSDDDGGLPFPADIDDGGLPFPADDDDDAPQPAAKLPAAPLEPPSFGHSPPLAVPPAAAKPPAIGKPPPPAAVKPPPASMRPPSAAAAKPPPAPIKPPPAPSKPPPVAAKPAPPSARATSPLPPFPGTERRPPAAGIPAPPIPDPFASDSGVMAGKSGVRADDSGTFDDDEDPFFSGDPDAMPELGSITHGDTSAFSNENPSARSGVRELDLELQDGAALELGELGDLDLPPVPATSHEPRGRTRPDFESPDFAGLDLPDSPGFDDYELEGVPAGGDVDLDLPASSRKSEREFSDLDLPAPTTTPAPATRPPATRPSAPPATPSPPARAATPPARPPAAAPARAATPPVATPPAAKPPARPAAPPARPPARPPATPTFSNDLDLPTAAGAAPLDLDLPTAGRSSSIESMSLDDDLSIDDLPMPASNLPAARNNLPELLDDFPAPDDGLPTPELDGFDALPTALDDFPAPLDSLPTPVDSLPTPAHNLPRAADMLPRPVEDLELDLDEPGERPRKSSAKPKSAPTSAAGSKSGKPAVARPGKPKRDISRLVVYGLLGLVVLGIGGGVLALQMGLLDPEEPPPSLTNGDPSDTPTPSGTEPVERPEGVLAKFDQDTPAAYVQAYELSEGDPLGRAEAALLLHLRYGPDPVRLSEAATVLAGYQDRPEPFVQRVIGLALLANGRPDEALSKFAGDGPRMALYRAWALLEKGDADKARTAAEAAVAARHNDQAAQLVELLARYQSNPIDGLAAMRQAAKLSPNHLALQEALMNSARAFGRLAEAAAIGQSIQPTTVSDGHKAQLLQRRAEIVATQGHTGEALRLLEQAVTSDPKLIGARIERIDLMLANKDFAGARADLELLLRDHATNPQVLKTGARIDLEAGRDEDARAQLAAIGESAAKDPEVQDLLGQAEAILMKVPEARAAFAAARTLDPTFIPALQHEVDLLVRAELTVDALALLDAHREILTQAGSNERGRRALAALLHIRASVLRAQGETAQALAAVDEALANDQSSNDALLLRAQLLGVLGRRQDHEQALLDLHERTGGYPGLTEPLGQVLLRKGKLGDLEQLIGSSLESPDASREILLTGAALRLAQARSADAEALAQRVLTRDPTDSRAHLLLGRALIGRGEYGLALDEIESAQTRDGDPEVELWLGQALEYNGNPTQARIHYTKALQLEPGNLEASALLGRLYAYDGAAAKAIELLEPVVTATDAYPYAHLALGLAHKDMGKRELAIADFQKAQQLDPTLFEAFYQEGRIQNDQNKHGLAVKALQAGLDKAKQNATEVALVDTYRRLGESYSELGNRSQAKAALEEYLKLAPASAAGRREVERLLAEL
jgi:tetratricopeptide (TPR) repeat protein